MNRSAFVFADFMTTTRSNALVDGVANLLNALVTDIDYEGHAASLMSDPDISLSKHYVCVQDPVPKGTDPWLAQKWYAIAPLEQFRLDEILAIHGAENRRDGVAAGRYHRLDFSEPELIAQQESVRYLHPTFRDFGKSFPRLLILYNSARHPSLVVG